MGARNHSSYWAFLGHRLSGITLAVFLPVHFVLLAVALRSSAHDVLAFTALPLVKVAELGLLVLVIIHLAFGLRLIAFDLLPAPPHDALRRRWIFAALGAALATAGLFLVNAL
jgi:fumarate reductase subunit D